MLIHSLETPAPEPDRRRIDPPAMTFHLESLASGSTPAPELVRASEESEIAAVESWWRSTPPAIAADFGIGSVRLGAALLVHAAVADVLALNRVLGLGTP